MKINERLTINSYSGLGICLYSALWFVLIGPLIAMVPILIGALLGPRIPSVPNIKFTWLLVLLPGYYIIGSGPSLLAGLIHGVVLVFTLARTKFLSNVEWLHSLIFGLGLGCFSGYLSSFIFFNIIPESLFRTRANDLYGMNTLGLIAGGVCGAVFTLWVNRRMSCSRGIDA